MSAARTTPTGNSINSPMLAQITSNRRLVKWCLTKFRCNGSRSGDPELFARGHLNFSRRRANAAAVLGDNLFNASCNVNELLLSHVREKGQGNDLRIKCMGCGEILRCMAADFAVIGVHVQGHPMNRGAHSALLQLGDELRPINREPIELEPDHIQVPG